ncbi:MAG: orotate phosphoribosyltransferase [Firmicutes bacterium]|nr:orotate phosphoribosyltransferase [Bacillota bacterium]
MTTSTLHELRQKLLRLIYTYSYRSGTFILSSGRSSSYYIDGNQVTMSPVGLHTTAQFILASLEERRIRADAVGGPTLGADPIAAAVALLGEVRLTQGSSGEPLTSFIVRKGLKDYGTKSQIEGPFYRGMRTVIVDDVLTTGGSVLKAVSAVEEAGGSIGAIYVLVDRLEGGREAIEKAGYLFEAAVERSALDKLQREMEQRFPNLSSSLQAQEISWERLPTGELQTGYPLLAAALEELAGAIHRAAESGTLESSQLQRTAGRFFSAVKAAVHLPGGEAEGLKLVGLMQRALAT